MPFISFRGKSKRKFNFDSKSHDGSKNKSSLANSISTAKSYANSVRVQFDSTLEGSADVTNDLRSGKVDDSKVDGIRNVGIPALKRKHSCSTQLEHKDDFLFKKIVEALLTSSRDNSPLFKKLLSYTQFAFEIPEDTSNQILDQIRQQVHAHPRKLNVEIERANNVMDKDTTGLSDPYCILQVYQDGEKIRHKSHVKHKEEHQFKITQVVPNTLNPVWNEQFTFVVADSTHATLVLDVWDHDKSGSMGKLSVKDFNATRFFKDKYQAILRKESDDFLGMVELHCDTIPMESAKQTLALKGRSSASHVRGDIVIKTWWESLEDAAADFDDVEVYREVLQKFINYSTNAFNGDTNCAWDGKLPKEVEDILNHLAILLGIPQYQQMVARFRAYAEYNLNERMSVNVLHLLLNDILKQQKSGKNKLQELEGNNFAAAIDNTIQSMFELLDRLFVDFEYNSKGQRALAGVIGFMKCAYDETSWKNLFGRGKDFKADLVVSLQEALDRAIVELVKESHAASTENSYGQEIKDAVSLTETVMHSIANISSVFRPVLSIVGVDVLEMIVNRWDGLLSAHFQGELIKFQGRSDHKDAQNFGIVFRLYEMLKKMKQVISEAVGEEISSKMDLNGMYSWFLDPIISWTRLASVNCTEWIRKTIKEDSLDRVDSNVMHSSSVLDTFKILNDLWMVWVHLEFPPSENEYAPMMLLLSDVLGDAAAEYTKELFLDTERKGFYDVEGRFDISESLCVVLNNTQEVILKYEDLAGEFLKITQKYIPDSVESLKGRTKSRLIDLRESLKDMIAACTNKMHVDIEEAMVEAVFKSPLCKDALKRGTAVSKQEMEKAASQLLDYLNNNLLFLVENVYEETFKRFLKALWQQCCNCVLAIIAPKRHVKNAEKFSKTQVELLKLLMENLKTFFHQDGDGIEMHLIESADYKYTMELLDLVASSSPPNELKNRYFKQLSRYYRHKLPHEERGEMNFTITKLTPNSFKLTLISGRRLAAMDRNGKSDPYVRIYTHPATHEEKSAVIPNTLNPDFNQSFEFKFASEDEMLESVVHLVVKDRDRLSTDDYIGECFGELSSLEDQDELTLKKRLHLTVPDNKDSLPFHTLRVMQRRPESELQKFAKNRFSASPFSSS